AEALIAAEGALEAAMTGSDLVGVALAQRERALRLAELGQPAGALVAWRAAAAAWQQNGDGPGQIEALGQVAALLAQSAAGASPSARQSALALARAERRRPWAAASELNDLGIAAKLAGTLPAAGEYFSGALAIWEKLAGP